jgi:hypothetical protein
MIRSYNISSFMLVVRITSGSRESVEESGEWFSLSGEPVAVDGN